MGSNLSMSMWSVGPAEGREHVSFNNLIFSISYKSTLCSVQITCLFNHIFCLLLDIYPLVTPDN